MDKEMDKDTDKDTDMDKDTDFKLELEYFCKRSIQRFSRYSAVWTTSDKSRRKF